MTGARKKVLFVTHELFPEGGGGVLACWMLQALAPAYEVTTLTWTPPDLAALDRKYGTSLTGLRFAEITPGPVEKWLVDRIPDTSEFQRTNYLLRVAKRCHPGFDALISCGIESDFGAPGIQYLHYPYLGRRREQWPIPGDAPWPARIRSLVSRRLPPWMLISLYSFERMRSNFTLTNSCWTLGRIGAGVPAAVLYPPAPGDFPSVPWEQRQDAFVCIGRLVPHKRPDWIAEVLSAVRRESPGLQLHICGSVPEPDYKRRLEDLAKELGPWVRIHYDLSRKDLVELLSKSRYGIHASIDEHFGIAPAEIARAGCIPFVHASGGQVEIVNQDPRLCYTTAEDAAAKILAVLRDAGLQQELRTAVYRSSERFTSETFVRTFLCHVENFLSARG